MDEFIPNNPKVSVIVPVYNVEKYICQCLDSVTNQTLSDIEILVLNDGSADSSMKICEEYKTRDKRIKVFSHDNRGLGETRNRGIELANGDYLFFVDSDDYIGLDYIEALYEVATGTNADIVQGENKMFFENTDDKILECDLIGLHNEIIDPESSYDFMRNIFFTHIFKHYAWNKLYKTDFIKENNIRFGDNKKIFAEDTWFQLQILHYRPHIAYSTGSYYYYRQRTTSIMHSEKKDLLKRQSAMIEDYMKFLKDNRGSELEYKVCGMISMDVFTMEALNQINIGGNFSEYRKALREFRSFSDIEKNVITFNKIRAYKLERNLFRRLYLRLISILYQYRMDLLAQATVWWTYKLIRK